MIVLSVILVLSVAWGAGGMTPSSIETKPERTPIRTSCLWCSSLWRNYYLLLKTVWLLAVCSMLEVADSEQELDYGCFEAGDYAI